jgi:hypothetical protein
LKIQKLKQTDLYVDAWFIQSNWACTFKSYGLKQEASIHKG